MSTQNPTHKAVQEYYGKVARESAPCCESSTKSEAGTCCGASAGTKVIQNDLYPLELLAELPADIANFTAGSGDPISLANLKPGETVLDLGSGGGLDCFLAAKQVGKGGQVIGVDMTAEMLERARSSAARMNVRNVEFRQGFLEALPVDDSSIDVIISNCVINLSPDKPQVFREMFRALKRGGRVAVSDIVTNRPLSDQDRKSGEDWCGCMSGALAYKEYIEELGKAGFRDVRLEPNMEMVKKAIKNGQVHIQTKTDKIPSNEELLEMIGNWEQLEGNMFVPHLISARKPG